MAVPTEQELSQESQVLELGKDLWKRTKGATPGIFDKGFWQGKMLESAMSDPGFKIDMFRFVDVLPALRTSEQVSSHLKEYLLKDGRELPTIMGTAIKIAAGGWMSGLAAKAVRSNVQSLAERFILGHDAADALPLLKKLHADSIAFTVDLLGEATTSQIEADQYQARYLDLIDTLAREAARWPDDELIDRDHTGPIPRVNVSIKVSAMEPFLDPVDPIGSVKRVRPRVLALLQRAKERGVFVNLDLEQWSVHGITYDLFESLVTDPSLRDWPHLGVVVQAYLRESERDAQRLLDLARRRGAPLTVRLVKGAYWEYEVVTAKQNGYAIPVYMNKAETDASYERLSTFLLDNVEHLRPAFASHNLRSVSHAIVGARRRGLSPNAYEVQMLYGMAEPERAAIRSMGNRVRVYSPIGELLPGMAYLVRRLLENTSNSGFLRLSHHDKTDIARLLAPPSSSAGSQPNNARQTADRPDHGFVNCPLIDFTDKASHERFASAVAAAGSAKPRNIPVVVNGRKRDQGQRLQRHCPSDPSIVVSDITLATREEADTAVRTAFTAWPAWRDRPLEERAAILEKLADRMQSDRFELAALQVYEVGKPWREADADVAEAIDFCRYYARQARIELAPRKQGDAPGETNILTWEGRGPTIVIAPWNFPLAILTGMVTAALVAGNPVILKPAETSSAVGYSLFERMIACGVPAEAAHFLPGVGREIGALMVDHPLTAGIAFTGSMNVGLSIMGRAAQVHPGQPQVKRVVCEMGGKNAIIVDDDADLDEAIAGVVRSAFGYAGQKCSACSRVLVVGEAYEPFIKRLTEACRALLVRPAHDPSCQLGPVIDEESATRLRGVVANPGNGANLVFRGEIPATGNFVPPTVFTVSDPKHPLMQDELFGPVLAVMKVDSFENAIDTAVDVPFALTAGVFSRSPSHLELARKRLRVGNLYLSRGCTGAMVDRQPFGGFRMSGGGTKAGGPGYLMHFVDPRVVTENTMRHGMTPDLS